MGVSSHPGETALKATPAAKIYDRRKAKLPRAGLGDFVETSNGLAILVPKEILLTKIMAARLTNYIMNMFFL